MDTYFSRGKSNDTPGESENLFKSAHDYKKAVAKLKPGQDVVFKILRRGDNDHTLTVFLPGVVPANNGKQ